MEEKKEMKTVRLTKLKKGETVFRSTGISKVKVTDGEEVICLEIPIKSTGISELIDSFNDKAPTPPVKNILVHPDDEIGKELGLTKKQWMKIPDASDPDYIKNRDKHNSDLGIAIVLKGVDLELFDENDKEIRDGEEKIKAMKEMGLSSDQFSQIAEDIMSLTKWTDEEKSNFFAR